MFFNCQDHPRELSELLVRTTSKQLQADKTHHLEQVAKFRGQKLRSSCLNGKQTKFSKRDSSWAWVVVGGFGGLEHGTQLLRSCSAV